MRPAVLAALALIVPAAAPAAERSFAISSFERLRVDGPFQVTVTTGRSPGAKASGEGVLLDRVVVEQNGDTLAVHMGTGGWGETPHAAAGAGTAPAVTITVPSLRSAAIGAGAKVSVSRMAAQRVDVSVNGAGSLALGAAEADEFQATVIGAGQMTLAGRAGRARLLTNGPGTIDAAALAASDLTVRLDGTGETKANARYTAQVTTTGLGRVSVTGGAKCVVRALAGGPVACGAGQ